ncbi:TPA: DNA circularization protein, partial [Pasteurella multocida]|nr:DNA circularization protein [Pasteurella multocida]
VISDLRTRGEQLANIKSVRLTDTFPAVVVQYQYSGKSQKWQQLAQRNAITHPLFCIGGNEIEVLQ